MARLSLLLPYAATLLCSLKNAFVLIRSSSSNSIKQQNLVLQVNVPVTANVAMKVMAEASIIDVQSQTVQVNSEDTTLGNAFGTQQIESLPFEGRDPTQILVEISV